MNKNACIATAFIVAVICLFPVIAEQKAFAGSLAAWGYNGWGQCDVPAGNKFFTAIAGGYGHSLALKSNGSLVAWGRNDYGQCNVPAGNNFTAISAGDYHSLALKSDGSLVAWGDNDYGQCNVPADNNFVAIAAGGYHCLALKSDGSVVAWGNNDYGQCNVPAGNYTAIAAGYLHSLALKSDGSLVGWGDNYFGQCNVPAGNYTAIAAGYRHNLALKSDGSIVGWGWNHFGQATPPEGNNFTAIAAGSEHSLALKSDGSLVAWGDNDFGQCNVPAGNNFTVIAAGSYHNLAIFLTPIALSVTPSNGLSSFGPQGGPFRPASKAYTLTNTGEQSLDWTAGKTQSWVTLDQTSGTLAGDAGTTVTVSINTDANSLTAGHYFDTVSFTNTTNGYGNTTRSVALRSISGSLAAWGYNDYGQSNVPADNNFVAIAAGEEYSLALKSDGSLVAWGHNDYGQCNVPAGNNFTAIAAGGLHSLAIKSDGSLVAWGLNDLGQCNVPAGNNFIAIAAGGAHSLALKSDGSLVAWGWNVSGQCNVPAGNNFTAIAAGSIHSLALKSDGSLVAWGFNLHGQCGVPAGNNFVAIAAGEYHSLALKSDGSLAAWGYNGAGQCNVPAGNNFVAIAAGGYHCLALKSDGLLVAWGHNNCGQCNVPAGNNFIAIAAGGWHSLAIFSTPAVITGTVTDDSNGLPIANIWVEAVNYETGNWCGGDNTDSNGFYEITNLATGTYRVRASGGSQYASEFYNNQLSWNWATPVNVSEGQSTDNINFSLGPGASISGVVKNSSGVGQANIQVNCWANDGYGTGDWTDANGFYKCDGLPVGYNYKVVAYPPSDSNYMITMINVGVYQPGEYTDKDIILGEGGLKISGKVTDKATTLPLADVRVNYWCEELDIGTDTRTDVNGMYLLTNLPPGYVQIRAEPESYYACIGTEFELTGDINNLDFALPAGAILSGKVLDADTGQPLADVEIDYWNGMYNIDRYTFTDVAGTFCLTQLPPGIAELKAKPDVDSGYAWNLPWESDIVCLGEGENRSQRIIALKKGALVRGYIKDVNGNASGIEYDFSGRNCGGWDDTDDVNGSYQIRLPVGTYSIALDEDEFGALPAIVTITDINNDVNVPDIISYTEETGGQISGEVNNPGGYTKADYFLIIAFKAGTALNDPNMWYTVQPIAEAGMENAGPFSLNKLPPDVNYDIYLCVETETPDELMLLAVRDSALSVAVGTTGIKLEYSSQGSTVTGRVKNTDDRPVLGAEVLLTDSSNSFGGFSDTDCNGQYVIHNVPAGTYTATAVHSKYLNTSTTMVVVDGIPADVNTIVMPFAGGKEGADLNGDGEIDMLDVLEFSQAWLQSGSSEADFNQDSRVNFRDWTRMAENWQNKAIWYHE